jgi:hypothetical protein
VGNIPVGHSPGDGVALEDNDELAVVETRVLDTGVAKSSQADTLEIIESLNSGEIGSDEITLLEDLDVPLLESLSSALLAVQSETGVEHRVVLEIEELIVVGLQHIGDDAGSGWRLSVQSMAQHSLDQRVGVGGTLEKSESVMEFRDEGEKGRLGITHQR